MGVGSSKKKRSYGWKKDIHDDRDLVLSFSKKDLRNIPSKVDLRSKFGVVYDQLELDACNANAICSLFGTDPSRMFLYFNEKKKKIGSSISLRDSIKTLIESGMCDEKLWPYDLNKTNSKPEDFETHFYNIRYKRIPKKLEHLKATLAKGYPFLFGFYVYDSFENCSGEYRPNKETENLLGGHCVCALGYSDKKQSFLIKNSMGKNWGAEGYFLMSYEFILSKECSDFWMFESITEYNVNEMKEKNQQENITSSENIPDKAEIENNFSDTFSDEDPSVMEKRYVEKKRTRDLKKNKFMIRKDM
jgi:C1A family cysteine protease